MDVSITDDRSERPKVAFRPINRQVDHREIDQALPKLDNVRATDPAKMWNSRRQRGKETVAWLNCLWKHACAPINGDWEFVV